MPGSNFAPFSLSQTLTSVTRPLLPYSSKSELSLISLALSPKMALNNLSSGVRSVSPLGEILPTKISCGPTSAPILIIPSESRSFNLSSLTLGMSEVVSSGPSLVSLISQKKSSIWIEAKTTSLTNFSEMMIASSKLLPRQGKKETRMFLPKASQPSSIAAPSVKISPDLIFCPFLTISFW